MYWYSYLGYVVWSISMFPDLVPQPYSAWAKAKRAERES